MEERREGNFIGELMRKAEFKREFKRNYWET